MKRGVVLPRAVALAALAAFPAAAQTTASGTSLETVVVVAPLPGNGTDPDKLPGEVETLSIPELLHDRQGDVLPNAVATQLASVSLNDEQGSQFQPDLVYRGFEASPISGIAEGIAVYQDGVRLNEALGDNVNWDLVPEFAVDRFTLESNNPVFGLNAIGGAVSIEMKNGLDFDGADAEVSGGSFGNITGNAEYGARFGDFGVYIGIGGLHDDGFRYISRTNLSQLYGDLAYHHGGLTLHLSLSGALNDIGATGPTPVEMLAADPRAVFTYPQSMRNDMGLVQFRGTWRGSDALSVSFSTYYRRFEQHLIDGNTTDVDFCANDPSELCLEGNYDYPGDALYDPQGNPVPASVLPAGATPGETDFTRTDTDALGAAAQLSWSEPIWDHGNSFIAGVSVDHGDTNYQAYGELGYIEPNLDVVGSGVIIDQAQSATAQPPIEEPVAIEARNTYTGIYAIDTIDVTDALSWTFSGRFNLANISVRDRLGTSLNGSSDFTHFNPGSGFAYKFSDTVTLYGGVSEANRAPTPGELSCANPNSPCILDAFLVSDPPLKQVVSHNIEAGLRGTFQALGLDGKFVWDASAYRTDADDDILLLGTAINGFGYFQNAGETRRQGIDLHLGYRGEGWSFNASYSYLEATFRDPEVLSSNSPAADANGFIYVVPGDRLPMNPANRLTLSADYNLTRDWSLGADLRLQSGQYLVGDESNQEPKLPGYTTVNLRTAYDLGPHFELFGEIENLFGARYYTYGTFTELDGLPPNFNLSDPRTYSPAPPRLYFVGLRARL